MKQWIKGTAVAAAALALVLWAPTAVSAAEQKAAEGQTFSSSQADAGEDLHAKPTASPTSAPIAVPTAEPAENTVVIPMYLVVDAGTAIPPVSFTLDLQPAALAGLARIGSYSAYAGITAGVQAEPAVFTAGQSVQTGTPTDAASKEDAYATSSFTLDFSAVAFPSPGVYRYELSMQIPASVPSGFYYDNTPCWLDVYVQYTADNLLAPASCVLLRSNALNADGSGYLDAQATNKTASFLSEYRIPAALRLSKTVTGALGDRNQYFRFQVSLDDCKANASYVVTFSTGSPDSLAPARNPTAVTTDTDGEAEAVFYLKNGQWLQINGLPARAEPECTETAAAGYTAVWQWNDGTPQSGWKAEGNINPGSNTAACTNAKPGVPPTGLSLQTVPYLVLAGLAAAGLLLTGSRRR